MSGQNQATSYDPSITTAILNGVENPMIVTFPAFIYPSETKQSGGPLGRLNYCGCMEWREVKVGIFAKRAWGASAFPRKWNTRKLPETSVVSRQLFVTEGFEIVKGFGAATDGNESGKEDFGEGIIDFPGSGIVDFFNGDGKDVVDGLRLLSKPRFIFCSHNRSRVILTFRDSFRQSHGTEKVRSLSNRSRPRTRWNGSGL